MLTTRNRRYPAESLLVRSVQPRQVRGNAGLDVVGPASVRKDTTGLFLEPPARERTIFFPFAGEARQGNLKVSRRDLRRGACSRFSVRGDVRLDLTQDTRHRGTAFHHDRIRADRDAGDRVRMFEPQIGEEGIGIRLPTRHPRLPIGCGGDLGGIRSAHLEVPDPKRGIRIVIHREVESHLRIPFRRSRFALGKID